MKKDCSTCRFATRVWIAFDDRRDFCSHPSAQINGEPMGFVSGKEAELCGCYQQGRPSVEDELVAVKPHIIPVHAIGGFLRAGN